MYMWIQTNMTKSFQSLQRRFSIFSFFHLQFFSQLQLNINFLHETHIVCSIHPFTLLFLLPVPEGVSRSGRVCPQSPGTLRHQCNHGNPALLSITLPGKRSVRPSKPRELRLPPPPTPGRRGGEGDGKGNEM